MSDQQKTELAKYFYRASAADFLKIPGGPIAYWVSKKSFSIFSENPEIGKYADARVGLQTGDNDRFLRYWHEISLGNMALDIRNRDEAVRSNAVWFPCNKGGEFRKWFGNHYFVVKWENDGEAIRNFQDDSGQVLSYPRNMSFYFREAVSWSDITSSANAFRYFPAGFINDATGHSAFGGDDEWKLGLIAYSNNKYVNRMARILNPTIHFHIGYFNKLPYAEKAWSQATIRNAETLISITRSDWNSYEISWNYKYAAIVTPDWIRSTLAATYLNMRHHWNRIAREVQTLEEENNRIFIDAYDLQDELTPEVPLDEITLTCNPHYRYGSDKSEAELETMLQCDSLEELVSYAIGCMMGRYSLDKPGLVLARQSETLQDYLQQIPSPSFAPDDDAILPLTDQEWFADDATNRFREFVRVVWGDEHLQENLDFVAQSLCLHAISPKRGESSLETIRRYLSTQFFKDHLRTYKKRPIYWLFSSGKHKAFECLVYLHRYNESTLSRMRTEYVIPLTATMSTYAKKLQDDIDASTNTAEKKRLEKELDTLHKQQAELSTFDEKLRHFADQRISLDLDDGVKVNYGKFGDLLAEVKAVTGDKSE